MNEISFWLKRLIPVVTSTLVAPFFFLFSRAWRAKILAAYEIWTNPFWDRFVPLASLLGDPLLVTVAPLRSNEHNCSEFELLSLGALIKQTQAKYIFEIGTYDGRSTRTLALNTPENGRVITLNLPPNQSTTDAGVSLVDTSLNVKVRSGCRFIGTEIEGKIQQVYGDSAVFDFSNHEGRCDCVFIDGSHLMEYVQKDTETAMRLAHPDGCLIIWHDAPLYDVVHYLRRMIKAEGWPLQNIRGTTLMIGYYRHGNFCEIPLPLSSL